MASSVLDTDPDTDKHHSHSEKYTHDSSNSRPPTTHFPIHQSPPRMLAEPERPSGEPEMNSSPEDQQGNAYSSSLERESEASKLDSSQQSSKVKDISDQQEDNEDDDHQRRRSSFPPRAFSHVTHGIKKTRKASLPLSSKVAEGFARFQQFCSDHLNFYVSFAAFTEHPLGPLADICYVENPHSRFYISPIDLLGNLLCIQHKPDLIHRLSFRLCICHDGHRINDNQYKLGNRLATSHPFLSHVHRECLGGLHHHGMDPTTLFSHEVRRCDSQKC